MAEESTVVPPTFDDAVREFIAEQLRREPFRTVGELEDQLSSQQKKLTLFEETLVRGPFMVPHSVLRSPILHKDRQLW